MEMRFLCAASKSSGVHQRAIDDQSALAAASNQKMKRLGRRPRGDSKKFRAHRECR